MGKCSHVWRSLYYRTKRRGKQSWIKTKDRVICVLCEKIAEIRSGNSQNTSVRRSD